MTPGEIVSRADEIRKEQQNAADRDLLKQNYSDEDIASMSPEQLAENAEAIRDSQVSLWNNLTEVGVALGGLVLGGAGLVGGLLTSNPFAPNPPTPPNAGVVATDDRVRRREDEEGGEIEESDTVENSLIDGMNPGSDDAGERVTAGGAGGTGGEIQNRGTGQTTDVGEGSATGGGGDVGTMLRANDRFPGVDISLRSYAEIESSISDLKKELKSFDEDVDAKIKEIKASDPKLKDPQNRELVKQLQSEKQNAEKIVRIQETQFRSLEGKTPLITGERPMIVKAGLTNMVTFDQNKSQKEIHDDIRKFMKEGELSDSVKSKIEKEKQSTPEYKKLKDILDQKQKLEQNFLKDNLDRIQGVQNNTFDANGNFQQLISSDPQKFKDYMRSMKDLQTKIDTLSGSIKAIDKEFEVRTKIEKYKEMGIGIEYDKKDPNMNYKLKQLERAFGVENSRQDQIAALENLQNKGVSFANPIFETIVTPTNGISLQPAIGQGNLSIYTNASGMEIRRPIPLTPADVVTSRPDDKRLNPVHGNIAQHTGTDYGISTGTKLGSVMEGKVVSVDIDPKAFLNVADGGTHNGASVTIESKHAGREIRTTYYHLSHVNVEPGAQVRMGDLIGRSGNSGSSGDPHLHFIIQEKVDGKWILQKNEEFDWKGVP